MSVIQTTIKLDGVLTDPTSVKLSDPAGTYGVKRNDTDAVVVADAVAMTKVSTGVYRYEFTDPAYDLEYTAYIETVYSGETTWSPRTFDGPESGSPSTLENTYTHLVALLGDMVGLGRTPSGTDLTRVHEAIDAGYRWVLYPPPAPGYEHSYEWSWLSKEADLSLVASTGDYALPADFGTLAAAFSYGQDESSNDIRIVSEAQIRKLRQSGTGVGDPTMAAVRAKDFDGTAAQTWEVIFWPTPGTADTLTYRYNVKQSVLRSGTPYPLAGEAYVELLTASCRAEADLIFNDGANYPLWDAKRVGLLRQAISNDTRNAPTNLGYMGDPGSGGGTGRPVRSQYVEYNGTVYGD